MNGARLTFAFTAGIVATVNPCGFAMLPAYLSFFLGIDRRAGEGSSRAGVGRALATGAVVTTGIVVVFGIVGIALSAGLSALRDYVPWAAIVIGAGLIALGVAILAGFRLTAYLPKFERGASGRDVRSLFLFGVSYAIASVSCGLATFLVVVTASAGDDSFVGGIVSFVLYALGMGMVLTSLAVSLALARGWLLSKLRVLMRYTDTIAAVLLDRSGRVHHLVLVHRPDRPRRRWAGRDRRTLEQQLEQLGGLGRRRATRAHHEHRARHRPHGDVGDGPPQRYGHSGQMAEELPESDSSRPSETVPRR